MGKWRWGVIIDAGSSGSRLHVYRWKDPSREAKDGHKDELHRLPEIRTKWTKKIRPGVSTFGDKPADVGSAHLQGLIDYALTVVPPAMAADTPVFLMATAGMRLLPAPQQATLLREMCAYLRGHTPFALPDCAQHIQVISGETEGLYGWLAANYLLGGFDHPEQHEHGQNHHTYGFLDMGGASAQIAFAPNTTEAAAHARDLQLVRLRTLDGQPQEHRVFSTTWLGFGVNQARDAYVQALVDRHTAAGSSGGEIPDPCLPKGLRTTLGGDRMADSSSRARRDKAFYRPGQHGAEKTLVGTGDFEACLVGAKPLLGQGKDSSTPCGSSGGGPCLIHDPVPSIDFNVNHFVGVSEYYHSTHGFFGEDGEDGDGDDNGDHAYDFATYQRRVLAFCGRDWDAIRADLDAPAEARKNKSQKSNKHKGASSRTLQDAQQACFKASWVINVLHEGIGVPRIGLDQMPGLNVSHEALDKAHQQGFVTPFRPLDKIDSVEVSWTLGRMLLYASGQVPPVGGGSGTSPELPVGFGSNVLDGSSGGIPADFTYAGSTWKPVDLGGSDDDGDDWGDAADDLLEHAREKPASSGGLLLFVVIMVVVAYLLRKRERRARVFSKVGALVRRRWPGGSGSGIGSSGSSSNKPGRGPLSSFLSSKLFGRRPSREYERVLEEGQLEHPFELGEMESDENDGSDGSDGSSFGSGSGSSRGSATRLARASGLATPQLGGDMFEEVRTVAGGSTMDRSSRLVASRERLSQNNLQMLNAGRRSRAASPTRGKNSLMALQED